MKSVQELLGTMLLAMGAAAMAGTDVNTANATQLDQLQHVGKSLSRRIVAERQSYGEFKDWSDPEVSPQFLLTKR